MNKSVAIYARVSTDDQAERGYSLPSQIEACEKFASQQGWESVLVYQDDISGTTPVSLRPSGYELQKEIDARNIQAVIVYQVDRLSRDIVDLLTNVRKWLQAGVGIYALDIGRITSENDIMLVIKPGKVAMNEPKSGRERCAARMPRQNQGRW